MKKMLKKLIELLPVSRRKYLEVILNITTVLDGLVEAEANHCQIETNIIQQLQMRPPASPSAEKKTSKTKNGSDPAFA